MPDAASKTVVERLDGTALNIIPHPDRSGDAILTPSNYYLENWWWGIKNEFGDPLGWSIGVPPAHEAHNFFMSERGKGSRTLVCQNFEPIERERPSFVTNQPWLPGHSPMSRSQGERSGMAPPALAAIITKEPVSKVGYKATDWYVNYYYETKKGRKTEKAPATKVTLPQGGRMLVTLPTEHVDRANKLVLCLGQVSNGADNTKPQKSWHIESVPETYELNGPFRHGLEKQKHKGHNDSKRGSAHKPKVSRKRSRRSLRKARYEIKVVENHPGGGDSLPSDPVIIDVGQDEPNTELEIAPDELQDEAIGWTAFVTMDGQEYEVFSLRMQTSTNDITQTVTINGDEVTSSGSDGGGATGAKSTGTNTSGSGGNQQINISQSKNTGKVQESTRKSPGGGGGSGAAVTDTTMTSSSAPTEDRTGLEDPTTEVEVAVLTSLNPLEPGDYIAAYSKVRGEYESRISPTAKFTLAGVGGVATECAKITVPHPINNIMNANFGELDSSDQPLDQTNYVGTGELYVIDGQLVLNTLGSKTTDTPYNYSNFFDVDRNSDYEAHAEIDIDAYASGNFDVYLNEYAIDNPTVASIPLRTTLIKRQSFGGQSEYAHRMGPWGQTWHADTTKAAIVHMFTGATRNMKVSISDYYFNSFKGGVRKYESVGGTYNPDPPMETALPGTSYKIVSKPRRRGKRRRTSVVPSYLDLRQFSAISGVPQPVGNNWQAFNYGTGSQGVEVAAAIEGSAGYRFLKTSTSNGMGAAWKTFNTTTRTQLGVRSLFQASVLNTRSGMYFMAVSKSTVAPTQNDWLVNILAYLYRWNDGTVYAYVQRPDDPETWYWFNTGVKWNVGDTLDAEIIVDQAGTNSGTLRVLIGKNGAERTQVWLRTGGPWSGDYAHQAIIGPFALDDWADTYNIKSDDWVVSDLGGPLTLDPPRPPLEPIPQPDRPVVDTPLISRQDFSTGLPDPGTLFRSTTTGTVAQVQASASTGQSAYGARLSDNGSSGTFSNVYYLETLDVARSAVGWDIEMRVPQRPTSGEITLARVRSLTFTRMLDIYLNSAGLMEAQLYTTGDVAVGSRIPIAENVPSGVLLRMGLILAGAGAAQGAVQIFLKRDNGSRLFVLDEELIDWTGLSISTLRVGGVTKSVTGASYSIDVGLVETTQRGSNVYEEFTQDGLDIEQSYLVLMPGQPVIPGMFLHEGFRAVEPGVVYTAGIKCRWAAIPDGLASFPFWIVAYDLDGRKHDLGCLVASREGLQGSSADDPEVDENGWVHLTLTLPPIPSRCYELAWESRNMVEGEYVCQSPTLSGGNVAFTDVFFPTVGSLRQVLSTRTPKYSAWLMPLTPTWRSFDKRHVDADGCTVTSTAWSSDLISGSDATPAQTDASLVPQREFAWVDYQVTSDGGDTPIIPSGSPGVEYELDVTDTFLMDDGSELPGGVVYGSDAPVAWHFYEKTNVIDLETGMVIRQPTGQSFGWMPGGKLQCCALLTMRYITNNWLQRAWIIQTPIEKILVRPTKEILMDEWKETPGAYYEDEEGFAYSWYELDSTGRFEVVEVVPHPWKTPEDVIESEDI